jgi:hypothetical protein
VQIAGISRPQFAVPGARRPADDSLAAEVRRAVELGRVRSDGPELRLRRELRAIEASLMLSQAAGTALDGLGPRLARLGELVEYGQGELTREEQDELREVYAAAIEALDDFVTETRFDGVSLLRGALEPTAPGRFAAVVQLRDYSPAVRQLSERDVLDPLSGQIIQEALQQRESDRAQIDEVVGFLERARDRTLRQLEELASMPDSEGVGALGRATRALMASEPLARRLHHVPEAARVRALLHGP